MEISDKARAMVGAKPFDVTPSWRNPDVAECDKGFKTKKSQNLFPRQLNGIVLSPCTEDWQMYCADYQGDSCRADTSGCAHGTCPSGLHECAALFRKGRTCNGNHPGGLCEFTKRHVGTQEDNLEDPPAPKKARKESPGRDHGNYSQSKPVIKRHAGIQEVNLEEPPPLKRAKRGSPDRGREKYTQSKSARSSVTLTEAKPVTPFEISTSDDVREIGFVDDDSIMQDLLHELGQERAQRRGTASNQSRHACHCLVAKVCENLAEVSSGWAHCLHKAESTTSCGRTSAFRSTAS